jgi:hypothetical protein
MKKQLLFSFAALLAVTANAQNARTIANPQAVKMKERAHPSSYEIPASVYTAPGAASAFKPAVGTYRRIGGSINVLGVQTPETRALQYNKEINTVGMVMRASAAVAAATPNGNSGTIGYAYSIDNGTTWDSTVVAASSTYFHRYPGGSMYNPSGNTNPANAYALVAGPWHPGANWQGVYFGAKQLSFPGDNTNGVVDYSDNFGLLANQRKQDFARIDYQTTADGKVRVAADIALDVNATTNAAYGWSGAMINTGTQIGPGVFNWTLDSLKPSFKVDNAGDILRTTSYNMAWSEDGQTGYMVFYGVDENAIDGTSANSYQPYVYKTINAGAGWSRHAPLFDFSSIQNLSDRLYPTRGVAGTLLKPFIYPGEGSGSTVDMSGDLHLLCTMSSAISDNIDSLGYTYAINYNQVWNYIVDFKSTSSGWCATVLDSLKCEATTSDASDPTGTGTSNWTSSGAPFAYDARLQTSRSTDGKFIFYSWADSDTTITGGSHVSIYPSIYMKGYDVVNDKYTDTKNVTLGSSADYYSYWFYASTKVIQPTATSFIVPATFTGSDDGSNSGDVAVSYYYINDATFNTSEFTISMANTCPLPTNINNSVSNVSGLGFYPNPASNSGTIEVVLNDNSKMDVLILNCVGQTVNTISVNGNAGVNKLDVNLSNLSAGLYFYQVKIGNTKSVTKKFVVEK